MRHPSSGLSEGDLSRLTGSSSSSSSCGSNNNNSLSSSSSSSPTQSPSSVHKQLKDDSCESKNDQHNHQQNLTSTDFQKNTSKSKSKLHNHQQSPTRFTPSYLPEFINPLDWQKSRKRKERLDSTSTSTQERKLQRSNSEELLPQEIPLISNEANHVNGNGLSGADNKALSNVKAAEAIRRVCSEDFQKSSSYAAYAQEFNEIFDNKNEQKQKQLKALSDENNAAYANRQNQVEAATRASIWAIGQPTKDMSRRVRNETSPARSQRPRDSDETENERRRSSERFCKTRAPSGRKGVSKKSSKYLPSKRSEEAYKYDLSTLKHELHGFVGKKSCSNSSQSNGSASMPDHNDNNLIKFNRQTEKTNDYITAQEALPWERIVPEDQQPILSRRYGAVRNHPVDNMEPAAKFSEDDNLDKDLDITYRTFISTENMRTRDLMQKTIPAMMSFQKPDERLKQVNKRLTSLKKRLLQLEESFERRMGYPPSHAERINDKYMKNILAELNKLRKEKHELKSGEVSSIGAKSLSGAEVAQKLEKMKSTLEEIEENLSEKRRGAHRSEILENLTPTQLLQEKTAVQQSLLYFEQLFGRPTLKDERDSARPLYTRYRLLKRMVARSVVVSEPELPTIPENEAFSLPQQISQNDSESSAAHTPSDSATNLPSSDDSTTTTTTTGVVPVATTSTSENKENISDLNLDQLWEKLDKICEEKRLLKRTIREYETIFEEQHGRKMLKNDRRNIEETYMQYKEKKAKTRLLQALIKKHIKR